MVVNFFIFIIILIFNFCYLRELRRYFDMGLEYFKNLIINEKWVDKLIIMIKLVNYFIYILLYFLLKSKK